jgi:dienelactone hydrolase
MRGLIVNAVEIMLPTFCALAEELPERITFPSADGHTTLTGYLFMPPHSITERVPAVVMMHGRAGAYSTNAKGRYDATTLSRRHMAWGELWAAQGYIALLVDGFSPRGYPQGFPRFSYETRPAELNEVTVRPLDAYGALAYLRARPDVPLTALGCRAGPMAAAQHSPLWMPALPAARGQDFAPRWHFIRPAG